MTDIEQRMRDVTERREKVKQGGGKERMEKQQARGKGTARERIDMFVDPGTFMELQPFVESRELNGRKTPGEGVVTGYAKVEGRLVFLFSQDFTVYGGTLGEMHAKKIANIMDLAAQNGAPIIGLNDSGGARIQEGVFALDGYGQVFYRNTQYSGVVPQISVIMGPCAGGAVYSPAMTDFVFMVEETSQMFITGPKVIESITGAEINSEDLGGARVHTAKSGNAHFTAPTEKEALQKVRRLLRYLPSSYQEKPPVEQKLGMSETKQEERDEKMLEIVPVDNRKAYDAHKVIQQILDEESFMEVQPDFAKNIVIGFGRINGKTTGIVANNPKVLAGGLDIDSSDKCARFIRFCNCFNIPLITLEDVSGFLPGVEQEHGGIIRHGAKMIYAYAEATVPKVTVILRKAIGGAYVALNSKAIGADMVFAWPNAEVAVMGPEGSANIVYAKEIKESPDPEKTRKEKMNEYKERFSNPYIAAKNGMIDDIIDPRETRNKLASALEMLERKTKVNPDKKNGNIPL